MKLLKNILPIIALLAIAEVDASRRNKAAAQKSSEEVAEETAAEEAEEATEAPAKAAPARGRTGTARKKATATTTRARAAAQKPAARTAASAREGALTTFPSLRNYVMKKNKASVIEPDSGQFKGSFLEDIEVKAQEAELGEDMLRALLQTARDQFVAFTGDNDKDLALLRSINQQIDDAAATLR